MSLEPNDHKHFDFYEMDRLLSKHALCSSMYKIVDAYMSRALASPVLISVDNFMRTASYLVFLFLVVIGRFFIPSQETVPDDNVENIFTYADGNEVVQASFDGCSLKVEIYYPKACRSEFSVIQGQDYWFNFNTARDALVLRRNAGSLIQFLPYSSLTGAINLQNIESAITTENCDGSIERDDTPDIKSIYLFQSLSDKEVHLLSISVRSCHLSKKICPQGASMDDTIIGAVVPFKLSTLGARPIEFGLSA